MLYYSMPIYLAILIFFFFNDTATTEIYTLSLHDALPISVSSYACVKAPSLVLYPRSRMSVRICSRIKQDRKSTRLNSSHSQISYAVFCLKKKICHDWSLKTNIDTVIGLLPHPAANALRPY